MLRMIRQGDVLFIPIDKLPETELRKRESGIIQAGEITGHHHRVLELENADVLQSETGETYLNVSERGVSIVHEEHGPQILEPSTPYRVHIAREYDYLTQLIRPVRD